jgi:DNA-binding transcriptional LysR family regulator
MDLSGQLKLHEIQTLEALSRYRSIARTAEALFLTPAAVHSRLKSLESKLGVPLYETAGHSLHLTQAAEVVLPHVRNLILENEAIFASLKEWAGSDAGRVRLATGSTFSSYLLPSLLEAFRRQAPDVEFVVETGKTRLLLDRLARGATDVAITLSSRLLDNPAFQVNAAWEFEFVLVAGPVATRPDVRGPCALADLEAVPFILHQRGSRLGELIDQYFAQVGFHPNVAMRFDHPATTKAMVQTGLGISLLPIWTVAEELARGTLARIELREPPLIARTALVTRRTSYTPRAVAAFVRMAAGWHWAGERRAGA